MLVCAALVGLVAAGRWAGYDVVQQDDLLSFGRWVRLSDQQWIRGSTGWLALGNHGKPRLNEAFDQSELAIGDTEFAHGIGSVAPSEIAYAIDSDATFFRATVGINRGSPETDASSVFSVFVDDVPLYTSPALTAGDPGVDVFVPLSGSGNLRLVVDLDGSVSPANLATWGNASVFESLAVVPAPWGLPNSVSTAVSELAESRANAITRERAHTALAAEAATRAGEIANVVGAPASASAASAVFDQERDEWVVSNGQIAVLLGMGGANRGQLSVLSRRSGQLVVDRSVPSVEAGGREYRLADGATADPPATPTRVQPPGFEPGIEVRTSFAYADGRQVEVSLTVLDQQAAFLLQLQPTGLADSSETAYRFLDGTGTFLLGDRAQYLTDVSRIRNGVIRDDGLSHQEMIDFGKPLVLWDGSLASAVVIASVDETDLMSELTTSLPAGQVQGQLRYVAKRSRAMGPAPRMYFEISPETRPGAAFAGYRTALAKLYPSKAPPSWVRYQWSTWYPYGLDYTEQDIRADVDFIADNLADLGPWHIVLDAGWFVSEGKPNSDFRTIDRSKFPRGLRPVVDYAHQRGLKVALYLSVPYVDSRQKEGDWVGLRGLVNTERACLEPLETDPTRTSFIFNFLRPCTHQYWESILRSFFVDYDVDGILMDGLGAADGAEVTPDSLDPFGLVDTLTQQSLLIYRFMDETAHKYKRDVYIETEWHMPAMAMPHSTTFRLADSWESFSHAYPYTGVIEDIDYAAFQHQALGQRYHMGWTLGDANTSKPDRWRRESALALGGLVGEGINLHELTDRGLTNLRAQLALQKPFSGQTFVDDPARPKVFGTLRDGLAFIGMANRGPASETLEGHFKDLGLSADTTYTVYTPEEDRATTERGTLRRVVPGESVRLEIAATQPGIVWTESSFQQTLVGNRFEISLGGPRRSQGFAVVYAPGLRTVTMDGHSLNPAAGGFLGAFMPGDYQYDPATGILRVKFNHDQPHVLRAELASAPRK